MSLAHDASIVKLGPLTSDAFLGGRLTIAQPEKGFRAGLDSVLLGAAAGEGAGTLLDLGAGAGTAALVALDWNTTLDATLAESAPAMGALAAENLAANRMTSRARTIVADVTAPGRTRAAAGLAPDRYESVIANPPFYSSGTPSRPDRRAARQMSGETLELWVKAAAAHAAPGGEAMFIHLAERLPDLLAAFDGRFGAITVLPFTPREGESAHRILIRGIKGSRAPLRLLASRALHTPSGRAFRPEFEAIFRGQARLVW